MSPDKLSIPDQTVDSRWNLEGKPVERLALDPRRKLASARRTLLLLGVAGVAGVVICLQFGAQPITFTDLVKTLRQAATHDEWNVRTIGTTGVILLQVRLPRVLLGFVVGASLAGVGVTLQALMRNPLADPYVLGVSSGAALGASLAVLFGKSQQRAEGIHSAMLARGFGQRLVLLSGLSFTARDAAFLLLSATVVVATWLAWSIYP